MSRPASTHLRIRVDAGLMRRLEASRKKNYRTNTGEVIARLMASFETEDLCSVVRQEIRRALKAAK